MATTYAVRSFSFGQIDLRAAGRVDASFYPQACKSLINAFGSPLGFAEKRPGTNYAGTGKTLGKKIKYFRWKLTQTSYIVIEAGNLYFRFYKNHAVLGVPYEVTTPWADTDLDQLEMIQLGTDSYWVHPSYAPRKLVYTSDTNWTLSTPSFTAGSGEENFVGAGHYPSHIELFQDRIVMSRTSLKPGTFWGSRTSTYENFSLRRNSVVTTPLASPGLVVWAAHALSVGDCVYFTTTGALPTGLVVSTPYYVIAAGYSAGSFEVSASPGGAAVNFTVGQSGVHTCWANPPLATDAWEKTPQAQASNEILWMLAEESLLFGTSEGTFIAAGKGQALNPDVAWWPSRQTANGSANIPAIMVDDFACFVSKNGRKIFRFQYQQDSDKYIAEDITQLNPRVCGAGVAGIVHQREPSTCLWAWTTDGQFWAGQYDRTAQSMAWSLIDVGGLVESCTVIPTATEDEVWISVVRVVGGVSYRYLEYFSPRGWTLTSDYNGVDSAYAWTGLPSIAVQSISAANPAVCACAGHAFANDMKVTFEDVTGNTTVNGSIFTVKNAIAGTSFQLYTQDGSTPVDYSLLAAGAGGTVEQVANVITGLTWLEGETVRGQGDGSAIADEVVAGGSVTLDVFANIIHIGLPFTAHIEPMPIANAKNKLKTIKKVYGLFYNTVDASVGTDSNNLQSITFQDDEPYMDTAPLSETTSEKLIVEGYAGYDGTVIVESSEALPMTLLSLMVEYTEER